MSLREEMWKYEQITGESAEHIPIIKLGAFLDGYEMGLKALQQQPCEDCISRAEAISIAGISTLSVNQVVKALEDLPSVTPKTRWIPCRERLPEEDGTLRGYLVNVGYWVGIAHFVNGEFWQSYAPEKMRFDYPVKAWMPLPTPYAESDKEEEE